MPKTIRNKIKDKNPQLLLERAGYRKLKDNLNWIKLLDGNKRLHAIIKGTESIYIHLDETIKKQHEANSKHYLVRKEIARLGHLRKI